MERYPALLFVLRYGKIGAILLAAVVGVVTALLSWPFMSAASLVLAIALGALVYLLAMCFVELITILTEMLVPR